MKFWQDYSSSKCIKPGERWLLPNRFSQTGPCRVESMSAESFWCDSHGSRTFWSVLVSRMSYTMGLRTKEKASGNGL